MLIVAASSSSFPGAKYRAPALCSAANFSTLRRARKRRCLAAVAAFESVNFGVFAITRVTRYKYTLRLTVLCRRVVSRILRHLQILGNGPAFGGGPGAVSGRPYATCARSECYC